MLLASAADALILSRHRVFGILSPGDVSPEALERFFYALRTHTPPRYRHAMIDVMRFVYAACRLRIALGPQMMPAFSLTGDGRYIMPFLMPTGRYDDAADDAGDSLRLRDLDTLYYNIARRCSTMPFRQ